MSSNPKSAKKKQPYIRATYRTPEGDVYNIHISEKEIEKAGLNAEAGIPKTHNRIREDRRIEGQVAAIVTHRVLANKSPYKVGDEIAYRVQYNRGTKKWPDYTCPVVIAKIVKVSPQTVETIWGRVSKQYILGRMKK